jgi:hypothetical protein
MTDSDATGAAEALRRWARDLAIHRSREERREAASLDELSALLLAFLRRESSAADPAEEPWRWRLRMAEAVAASLEGEAFGLRALYVCGSAKNATAGPESDLDLIVHFAGTGEQRERLRDWLEGWSLCLAELNRLRTGHRSEGLLDVHWVSDEDIRQGTCFAAKIGAVSDAARPLPLGKREAGEP